MAMDGKSHSTPTASTKIRSTLKINHSLALPFYAAMHGLLGAPEKRVASKTRGSYAVGLEKPREKMGGGGTVLVRKENTKLPVPRGHSKVLIFCLVPGSGPLWADGVPLDSGAIDPVGLTQRRADGLGRIGWSSGCLLSLLPRGHQMLTVQTVAHLISHLAIFS